VDEECQQELKNVNPEEMTAVVTSSSSSSKEVEKISY